MSVNVKDYGATGDGVTDDTQAFLDALAVVLAETGTLYCPTGTYKISQQLEIDQPFVGIKGDGMQSTILQFTGSGLKLSSFADFAFGVVEDLTIRGSGTGTGIEMPNSNYYFLNRFLVSVFDTGIDATTAVLSKFTNFSIIACRVGAQFTNGSYAVTIHNGNVRGCTEAGIVESGSRVLITMTDVEAIGTFNTLTGMYENGTAIQTGAATEIRDSHIETSGNGIGIASHGYVNLDNVYIGGCVTGIKQLATSHVDGWYSFKNIRFSGCTDEFDIPEVSTYQIEDCLCYTATGGAKAMTTVPPLVYGTMKGLSWSVGGYAIAYRAQGMSINGKNVLTAQQFNESVAVGTVAANSTQQFAVSAPAGVALSEWGDVVSAAIISYNVPPGLVIMPSIQQYSTNTIMLNVTNTTGSAIAVGTQLFRFNVV